MTPPVGIDGAAEMVGVSKRSLDGFLAKHRSKRLYERRGNKRVFYPEHIREIRRLWHSDSTETQSPASGKPVELSKVSESERARARLNIGKPRKSELRRKAQSSIERSAHIIPLGPKP